MTGKLQVIFARARWLLALLLVLLLLPTAALAKKSFDLSKVLTMSDRAKARLPQHIKQEAIHKYGLRAVALSQGFLKKHDTSYRYKVPKPRSHQVRDQQQSGNCWIFATGRVLASKLYNNKQDAPMLSPSYINYHMLRKVSNALLKEAARAKDRRPDMDAVSQADEGGYQIWAMDIIKRHGFVPECKMPTTADAADSGVYINRLQALIARAKIDFSRVKPGPEAEAQRTSILKEYQGQVDDLLNTALGKPPRRFTHEGKRYTPRTFARKHLGFKDKDLDYVTLTHYPNRAWNRRYKNSSWTGMKPFEEYNVSMEVLQHAVKKTIRSGEAVLLGVNVGEDHPHRASSENLPDKAKGILSKAAFKYDKLIPSPSLSKRDKIKAGLSSANHAMAITGYDPGTRPGSVLKWKVENSHGPKAGDKGYFHMYDDFFRRHVEDVVVPRSSVPASVLKTLESRPAIKKGGS